MTAAEIARWTEAQRIPLQERWLSELRARADLNLSPDGAEILSEFLELLVELLPGTLGPFRSQVDPLWRQTSELFGNFASLRGLASGEVIEEFQLLREVIIGLLYLGENRVGDDGVSFRDLLRLNRVVDRGVTMAAVGHTDAMFFSLFQGSGVRSELDAALGQELREQLRGIREEYRHIMGYLDDTP